MSEDSLLVCYQVRRGHTPKLVSVTDYCSECGVLVWRALSSPRSAKAICFGCMTRKFKDGDVIEPPSSAQVKDITGYRNRHSN